jgi:hypothetical protein
MKNCALRPGKKLVILYLKEQARHDGAHGNPHETEVVLSEVALSKKKKRRYSSSGRALALPQCQKEKEKMNSLGKNKNSYQKFKIQLNSRKLWVHNSL